MKTFNFYGLREFKIPVLLKHSTTNSILKKYNIKVYERI
ncbi:hypothetical protein GM3709_335 [Geminocystis sp. NIES-3709]|nr:hypothetical protein GM3709_335 [Geminocystis sp. NIES-3709]